MDDDGWGLHDDLRIDQSDLLVNFVSSVPTIIPVTVFFGNQTSGCHEEGDGGGEDEDFSHSHLDCFLK
jgi:hypothetical protein